MTTQKINPADMARDLLAVEGLFDQRDPHLSLALYRLLAEGTPVSADRLAGRAGRPVSEVTDWLRGGDRIELDDAGEAVGFVGFTLRPTRHVVEVDGRTVYAGCAADVLFFPELLGKPARARSTDPITGQVISLSMAADGSVRELEPATAVVSWAVPDGAIEAAAIPESCGPVNFFDSPESGARFTAQVAGAFLLTIAQSAELVAIINQTLYGSVLHS